MKTESALTQAFSAPPLPTIANPWATCRFLTCSVLPVRMACDLDCKFCFSKSSISSLRHDSFSWTSAQLKKYFAWSRSKGAYRLVITGGGEPLLRPETVEQVIRAGRKYFNEIALFTNGTRLTRELARRFAGEGLSYICFSRHHYADAANRALMGAGAVGLEEFFETLAGQLKVRATCVLCRGFIAGAQEVWQYIETLRAFGVAEFTFKHTYVAYGESLFGGSSYNAWAQDHQINEDPFAGAGETLIKLPWGPEIKKIGDLQVCYYYEPTPEWELNHQLCRSSNLLTDGSIYASLEDQRSRLWTLNS